VTIIAYCSETDRIFADSRYTFSNGRQPVHCTKVRERRGYKYAAAGHATTDDILIDEVIKAIEEGKHAFKCDLVIGQDGAHMFVRTPGNQVYTCSFEAGEDLGIVEQVNKPHVPWAQGSGSHWAHAYRALGHSVEECVNLVAQHNVDCGFPIDVF